MEYKNKYLKYKIKYNNLKKIIGGFRLNDIKYENYLYNQVKTYLNHFKIQFKHIITYINLIQYKVFYNYNNDVDVDDRVIQLLTLNQKETQYIFSTNKQLYLQNILKEYISGLRPELTDIPELKHINDDEKEGYDFEQFFQEYFKIILDYINNILKSEGRTKILTYLFEIYLSNKPEHINLQYAAFVYLSFLLEFELFIMTYCIHSYNYFISEPYNYPYTQPTNQNDIIFNNDFNIQWDRPRDIPTIFTKSVYNKRFKNNIISIFEEYIKYLEDFYKDFIAYLAEQIGEKYYSLFYKDNSKKEYDHIKHDWYEKINERRRKDEGRQEDERKPINLNNIMNEFIRNEKKHGYNTHQIGLFDFVFGLNNTRSCITLTTLKIYLASRLHIKDINLQLQRTELRGEQHPYHEITQELLNCYISHWECSIDGNCTILSQMKTVGDFSIYNSKIEVFIAIIIEIYNRYNMINKSFGKLAKFNIIDELKFILNLIISILINNHQTYLVIKLLFKYNLQKYTDDSYKSDIFLLDCIKKNHFIYGILPIDKKDDRVFTLEAIKQNHLIYHLINSKFKDDKDFALKAIKRNYKVYNLLPKTFKNDRDFSLEAIKQNYLIYHLINSEFKDDKDFSLEAIKQNDKVYYLLSEELKKKLKEEGFILKTIEINHQVNDKLPEELKDEELKDEEFILKAIERNYLVYNILPEKLKEEEFILKAIERNYLVYNILPEKFKIKEFILKAIERNYLVYNILPEKLKEEEFILKAIERNYLVYNILPEEFKIKEFILKAIERNYLVYNLISEELKEKFELNKKTFALNAIENNYFMYNFIPEEFKNEEEFIFEANERNHKVYDLLPKKFKEDASKLKSFLNHHNL